MRVEIVPCLRDNYAYLVVDDARSVCLVVDPSETEPVEQALARAGLRLDAILCTHHHHDHVGGVDGLLRAHPGAPVHGHASDRGRIPGQTVFLQEGDRVEAGSLSAGVLHIPGHTLGAVAYVFDRASPPAVFTGDTLFTAGCGRLFEGDPPMMHASLGKLATLAGETLVYCGHEYTESNLRFAVTVEPDNATLRERQRRVSELRARREPTVPSTIADELATNPFLRTESPELRRSIGASPGAPPAEILGDVRRRKDAF